MELFQTHWRRAGLRLTMALAALSLSGAAFAQSNGDAPGRVARLSDLGGQVWLYTPDAADWVTAVRNRPLTSGDRLATDAGARAELQIGSTTLRLDANTELEVVQLDDGQAALQLHSGSAAVRIRSRDAAREFTLTTVEGRFRVDRPGRYRFDRTGDASAATVNDGAAVYEGRNSALTVNPGQRAEFWIDASGVAQYSTSEPARDAFAAYNGERSVADDRSVSQRYVSPEMTGADELDRYGNWEQSADYGPLWVPRGVAVDWAPYSTGHWAFVRPWGWTWVDDAPWGFAPFHYGRWVYNRNVWCWAPGTIVARPIYAPALVAWIGAPGINVSVSIGGGGPAVGWFPLAPREVYVPSYRYSPRYVREINVTNVTNVTVINNVINTPSAQRDFSNRRFPHALTVVPTSVVANRQPVAPAAAQLRGTPWVRNLAEQPAGRSNVALAAAPVAAPVMPARQIGGPATRPPGFAPRLQAERDRPEPVRDQAREQARDQARDQAREPVRDRAPALAAPIAAPAVLPPPGSRPAETARPAPQINAEPAPIYRRESPPVPTRSESQRPVQVEERSAPPAITDRAERRAAPPAAIEQRRTPPPSPVERRQIPERREAPEPAPVVRPAMRQEQVAPQVQAPQVQAPQERRQQERPQQERMPQERMQQERPQPIPQAPRQVEAPQRPAAPQQPPAARQMEPRPQAAERREQRPGAQQQER